MPPPPSFYIHAHQPREGLLWHIPKLGSQMRIRRIVACNPEIMMMWPSLPLLCVRVSVFCYVQTDTHLYWWTFCVVSNMYIYTEFGMVVVMVMFSSVAVMITHVRQTLPPLLRPLGFISPPKPRITRTPEMHINYIQICVFYGMFALVLDGGWVWLVVCFSVYYSYADASA